MLNDLRKFRIASVPWLEPLRNFTHIHVEVLVIKRDNRLDFDRDAAWEGAVFDTRLNRVIADRVAPLVVRKVLLLERDVRIPKVPLGFPPFPSGMVCNQERARMACDPLLVAVIQVVVVAVCVTLKILTSDEIFVDLRPLDFLQLLLARVDLLSLVLCMRFESQAKILSITQHRRSVRSAIVRDVSAESLESFRDKRMMAQRVLKAKEGALMGDARAARAKDVPLSKDIEIIYPNSLTVEKEGPPPIFLSSC